MGHAELTAIADRGYYKGEDILLCEQDGVVPMVPRTLTSGAKADGRFGKQDFVYMPEQDAYRCPARQTMKWWFNLHRELVSMGYHGGYTAVTDLLREIRPIKPPSFEVRFETPPGRQAQVDFAHFCTVFTDEPGVERVMDGRGQRRITAGDRTTPAPANSQTPRHGPPPGRSGEVVTLRPLSFYDAVGKRLAADGAAA